MGKIRSANDLKVYVGGEIVNEWGTFKRNKGDIKNEFLDNGNQHYTLTKILDGFYNKALMYQNLNNNNNYILVSYNTIVAEIFGGHIHNIWILFPNNSETRQRIFKSFRH